MKTKLYSQVSLVFFLIFSFCISDAMAGRTKNRQQEQVATSDSSKKEVQTKETIPTHVKKDNRSKSLTPPTKTANISTRKRQSSSKSKQVSTPAYTPSKQTEGRQLELSGTASKLEFSPLSPLTPRSTTKRRRISPTASPLAHPLPASSPNVESVDLSDEKVEVVPEPVLIMASFSKDRDGNEIIRTFFAEFTRDGEEGNTLEVVKGAFEHEKILKSFKKLKSTTASLRYIYTWHNYFIAGANDGHHDVYRLIQFSSNNDEIIIESSKKVTRLASRSNAKQVVFKLSNGETVEIPNTTQDKQTTRKGWSENLKADDRDRLESSIEAFKEDEDFVRFNWCWESKTIQEKDNDTHDEGEDTFIINSDTYSFIDQ